MKLPFFLSLVVLASCKPEAKAFKAGNTEGKIKPAAEERSEGDALPEPEAESGVRTKEIDLKTFTPPMDMVWVIDNSGSMAEEIAKVKLNFGRFMATVSSRADLKLTLVSSSANGGRNKFGLDLEADAKAKGHQHYVQTVESTNPLLILSSLICRPETTSVVKQDFTFPNVTVVDKVKYRAMAQVFANPLLAREKLSVFSGKICSLSFNDKAINGSTVTWDHLQEIESFVPDKLGELSLSFREGSRKVFVFVTDDNAKSFAAPGEQGLTLPINETNFFTATGLDPEDSTVFAFAGPVGEQIPATPGVPPVVNPALPALPKGCMIARPGQVYSELSKSTGGKIFDICQEDWSKSFDELSKNIVEIAQKAFLIEKKGTVTIKSVTLADQQLTPAQYELKGRYLHLKDNSLPAQSGILKIEYTVK